MTIHFYLERKNLKSKERAIYCYIRGLQLGNTIILNTNQKIEQIHWNKENERAVEKGKYRYFGAQELNSFLDSFEEEIKKTYRLFLTDNHNADYESIKLNILEAFGKKKINTHSFFEALDLFIETRKKDLSPDSIKKFHTVKKHLAEYEKRERTELTFSKIDLLFYDKFLSYLINDKNMVNNSAYKLIGLLKIYLNWSYERGINKYEYFKKFKIKEEKVDIVALTSSELEKLYSLDLSSNQRLARARDLFVFGCYTGGRFGDLINICREDIKGNKWYLRVKKTRDVIEIPLTDHAITILDKYQNDTFPLPRLSNQKLNIYIKEACEKAELNEIIRTVSYSGSKRLETELPKYKMITVHTARRTFITQSLLKGMKMHIVMAISGHKNYKTFKKYLDITMKDKEEEMNRAWNANTISIINKVNIVP